MKKRKIDARHSIEKYILKKVPIVQENFSVGKVLSILGRQSTFYDSTDYIYITDKSSNLIGAFSTKELFNNRKNIQVGNFMQRKLITVSPDTDIETIAHLALKHDLKAIPVVKSNKMIGIVPSRRIISILNRALKEDIFHFAGVHKSHLDFENSLEIPIFKAIKGRIIWLIVGLLGSMLIALYMGLFEETLAKYIIIASFVPAIVYISDALGTQVQTIFIRDLAILRSEMNLKKYFLKQMMLSSVIATIMGTVMFLFISIFWRMPFIAFVIALAGFFSLIITSLTSIFIPLLIKRFDFDPALGSGPIATIISDMTSVIIYFIIVTQFI